MSAQRPQAAWKQFLAHEAIHQIVEQQVLREAEQREAAARAHIVARIQSALEDIGWLAYGDAQGDLGSEGLEELANAAADVFVDIIRNPPSFVTYPDGTERIEQRIEQS